MVVWILGMTQTTETTRPADTLFPAPQSPSGRVLGHLVSLDVPGTPLQLTRGALATGAGIQPDDAIQALRQLERDGFLVSEGAESVPSTNGVDGTDAGAQSPAGSNAIVTVTVLLAPPLQDYGISSARWGGTPARPPEETPITPPVAPSTPTPPAAAQTTPATPNRRRRAAAANHSQTPHAPAPESPIAPPSVAPAEAQNPAGEAPQSPAGPHAAPGTATTAKQASTDGEPVRAGKPGAAGTRRQPAAGPAVDETAVLRGFVERFEQLLAEMEEWKTRAQRAEQHATEVEKLLRSAERRAATAEERLTAAQERAQSWAELTRRMQELARKADAPARARGGAAKPQR
ncbi:MAG: hypothetical protein AVDCRST_MAG77-3526 [uncultured Chloroflexi bacterium]|uniref:Uncharacterized protein n=1 Tax=uncultured Chloroflexota bacterium TaxID=166587 RepID=A0A6J4JG04_9CHLR|nr:MAG: hypothetical protein AVDCRST_MAG77-3526 [uncultured Chloroflexota bacterium]